MGVSDISNMVGYNYRLGEIECAIGIEQLKKLPKLVLGRQKAAEQLSELLSDLKGLRTPTVMPDCTLYYMFPMVLDIDILGVSRAKIIDALSAEGITGLTAGYVNVHLLPMYQQKLLMVQRVSWSSEICRRDVSYNKGSVLLQKSFTVQPIWVYQPACMS